MAFHCPNCNGRLVFDIDSQLMKCEHCGSTRDPQEYVVRDQGIDSGAAVVAQSGMARFTCQNCGAELEGTDDSLIGFCPYCGGQSLVMARDAGAESPEYLLPFAVSKDRCMSEYARFTKHVRYLPKELKDSSYIQNFTGIYMPFNHYDVRFDTSHISGKKTVVHTSRYDKINHYSIEARVDQPYERGVTFDSSRYLDDEIAERSLPFDLDGEKRFHPAYLAGFYADASTVDAGLYTGDARDQAATDLVEHAGKLIAEQTGIDAEDSVSGVRARVTGYHAALLPLWFLTWRKGDRVAYAVVNGQTGKVVSDMPLDEGKFWIGSLVASAAIFAVLELLFQPTPLATSLVSLLAALIMCFGIRSGAAREYNKQQHTADKGWNAGASDAAAKEAGMSQNAESDVPVRRRKRKKAEKMTVRAALGAFGLAALWGAFVLFIVFDSLDEFLELAGMIGWLARYIVPVAAIITALVCTVSVTKWFKHTRSTASLVAQLVLLVTVMLNTAVVVWSPVNDAWYYAGDAVCILGLIVAAVGMIRTYNRSTTRPLPKLFDRKEV